MSKKIWRAVAVPVGFCSPAFLFAMKNGFNSIGSILLGLDVHGWVLKFPKTVLNPEPVS